MTFLVLGTFRLGNLARFIPYPVIGGFLAGTGWLLMKGGLAVAASTDPQLGTIGQFIDHSSGALASGLRLRRRPADRDRVVKRALVIPAVLVIGLVAFAIGMLVTGSSIERGARRGSGCSVRSVRTAVAALDLPRPHRRRLVGGARTRPPASPPRCSSR